MEVFLTMFGVSTAIGVILNFLLATYFVIRNYIEWKRLTLGHYVPVGVLALISLSSFVVLSAIS